MASVASSTASFASFRGVFVGSGSDGMGTPGVVAAVMKLASNEEGKGIISGGSVHVVYLGTATYDDEAAMIKQTEKLTAAGATVSNLAVAWDVGGSGEMQRADAEALLASADAIVVSGGNTLFAVDRWRLLGIDQMLAAAAERGSVLAGGSAGAICWFDSGHSDSGDPESFRPSVNPNASNTPVVEPASVADAAENKKWEYVRVEGLGLFPGLVCPHYDKVQSNGLLRADDFNKMVAQNPAVGETPSLIGFERGIGIDHYAALVMAGDGLYTVIQIGDQGSMLEDGTFTPDRSGKPAVWMIEAEEKEGQVESCRTLVPSAGSVNDLVRPKKTSPSSAGDPALAAIRAKNPADASRGWSLDN